MRLADASAALERFEAMRSVVIAREYFHGQVNRLQALSAPAAIRVMQADQLAVAMLDQFQRQWLGRAVQLEQLERRALLVAALHARPETGQQALHVVLVGIPQIAQVKVVLAQRILFGESGTGRRIGQQLHMQWIDLQMAAGLGPESVAQQVQCVEHQEMRAKQHQFVGQRQIGHVRAVPPLELLDQLVLAAALGLFLQQNEQVVWQIQCGGEVVHRPRLAQGQRRRAGAGSHRPHGERAAVGAALRVKCAVFASHPDT